MEGGRQTGETDHGGEHHVDGPGLDNLVKGLMTGIHLHVGHVGEQRRQWLVIGVVGYDHRRGMETVGLFGQLLITAVGRQTIGLITVGMLGDDV